MLADSPIKCTTDDWTTNMLLHFLSVHGFSFGFCINEEEGYLLPTIAQKITCRRFDWMLQSSSGRKWFAPLYFCPDDDWSIHSASVGNRTFFFICFTEFLLGECPQLQLPLPPHHWVWSPHQPDGHMLLDGSFYTSSAGWRGSPGLLGWLPSPAPPPGETGKGGLERHWSCPFVGVWVYMCVHVCVCVHVWACVTLMQLVNNTVKVYTCHMSLQWCATARS